jgi:hypothetical protein
VEFYFGATLVGKSVWTLVRQLRGPHLRMRMMKQAIEERRDGGGIPEELAPVIPADLRSVASRPARSAA